MMLKKEWQELRKKFNKLKKKSCFFSETDGIVDESERGTENEDGEFILEFVDEGPIMDESKSELKYK